MFQWIHLFFLQWRTNIEAEYCPYTGYCTNGFVVITDIKPIDYALGCTDANATNYNANADEQSFDQVELNLCLCIM